MIAVQTLSTSIQKETDPLSLFRQLCQNGEQNDSLLFETADSTDAQSAKSILQSKTAIKVELKDCEIKLSALSINGESLLKKLAIVFSKTYDIIQTGKTVSFQFIADSRNLNPLQQLRQKSVFDVLRTIKNQLKLDKQFEKQFMLSGVFSYDLVDYFEQLSSSNDSYRFPDFIFFIPEQLIQIEHQSNQISIYQFAFCDNQSSPLYQDSLLDFNAAIDVLNNYQPVYLDQADYSDLPDITDSISDADFAKLIETAKDHIIAGDVYQIVPSRTFRVNCDSAIDAYQNLRQLNPSPYMFYIRTAEFTLFGASPETAVKYDQSKRRVSLNPIAGTKPRAIDPNGEIDFDRDNRNEMDLLLNHKEISEHIMLLDLARNDIAKISEPGSRRVSRMMQVEKYSHVMHLVSEVEGKLAADLDALHAYQACSNPGTLTGSPKIKATQLLRGFEKDKRGPYGGAVGYLNVHGDMDTCIVIRSALVIAGKAYIQAGAGIVLDSDPKSEVEETRNKAAAVIASILSREVIV